jgi:protein-S-isoprenylcysteine O-methyltransferase Ste14
MPTAIVILGDVLVALGLYVTFEVLRQNRFAASTIETMAGQKVISTGLYGIVRHPMYFGIVIMTAGVPLALGSYWGLLVLVVVLPILMWRITDEEKMLVQELDGYSAYRQNVRFRLAPGLW